MAGSCRSPLAYFVPGLILLFAMGVPLPGYSQDAEPLVAHIPQTNLMVTVTEGPGEPRSIGSYALRLYRFHDPALPFDDFVAGTVRYRDGFVETLRFDDVDGDETTDLVVIVRSAGSGGYLSANAFNIGETGLTLIGMVEGLPGNADPVSALRFLVSGR